MRLFLTILSLCCYPSYSYKILIYAPKLFLTHVNFLGHIADALVTAGHDVVFYMPTYDRSIRSNGTKFARTIEYRCELAVPYERGELFGNVWAHGIDEAKEAFYWLRRLSAIEYGVCEQQLNDNNLLSRLRNEHFDVVINEGTALCGYALSLKIGVKKQVSALPTFLVEKFIEPFAVDVNPSHIPVALSRSTDLMGFWERVYNVIGFIIINSFAETVTMPTTVQLLRKYFGPSIDRAYALDVAAQSTFLFVNANEFFEFPRPINRKLVYASDIDVDKPQPLNEEFRNLMDSAKDGVVLVSMGSIATSSRMPMRIKNAFVNSFRTFPNVTFIWKYEEEDDLGCDSQNIIKKKWVPQNDLLAHVNMRAFLTHGGISSMAESVRAGVPTISIPLFFDHRQNAKKMEKHHMTIVIEKDNITTTSISWALRNVLYDQSFVFATRRLASFVNDSPATAEQRVVRSVEFAALLGEVNRLDLIGRTIPLVYFYHTFGQVAFKQREILVRTFTQWDEMREETMRKYLTAEDSEYERPSIMLHTQDSVMQYSLHSLPKFRASRFAIECRKYFVPEFVQLAGFVEFVVKRCPNDVGVALWQSIRVVRLQKALTVVSSALSRPC